MCGSSLGLFLSLSLSLCPFVPLSLCLFVSLSLCLFVSLSLGLLVSWSLGPFVPLSLCPFVSLSLCLFVSLSLSLCPGPHFCAGGIRRHCCLCGASDGVVAKPHKKTAQERREQRFRAEARMSCRLMRGLEQVHAHTGCKLPSVGVALRAALACLEATQREAADGAAADEAARVQAEMTAELERQRVDVERLAADAVQRAADEEIIKVPGAREELRCVVVSIS